MRLDFAGGWVVQKAPPENEQKQNKTESIWIHLVISMEVAGLWVVLLLILLSIPGAGPPQKIGLDPPTHPPLSHL